MVEATTTFPGPEHPLGDDPHPGQADRDQWGDLRQTYYNLCKTVNPKNSGNARQTIRPQGSLWFHGNKTHARFTETMPPNTWGCGWGGADDGGAIPASSRHSGGINAMMGDGSVKFIKDSINLPTWWALGTRAGSEVVSADAF